MMTHRQIGAAVAGVVALTLVFFSVHIVEEGHVGIVKRFSKAIAQVDPGLRLKVPFVDTIEAIEVRQRKNTEELAAATQNQLPVTANVSINWTVDRSSAMELFIQYGGLEQFESRILDPKLRNAAKAAISQFPAAQLIRNRQAAVNAIMDGMTAALADFPVTVNSPQIENLVAAAGLSRSGAGEGARERERRAREAQARAAAAGGVAGGELGGGEREGEAAGSRRGGLPGDHRSDGGSGCDSARDRAARAQPPVRGARAGEALGRRAAADRAGRGRRGVAVDAGAAPVTPGVASPTGTRHRTAAPGNLASRAWPGPYRSS